jgi:hypothetical protein
MSRATRYLYRFAAACAALTALSVITGLIGMVA